MFLHLTGTFGAFREYENVLSYKIVQKKCKCYLRRMLETCECAKEVYVQFSVLKFCLLMFCWRKGENPRLFWCSLLTLHWVSSTPTQLIGDGDNSCVHVYSRTFKNVLFFCFHSICKIYLPYSGFYCGIILSGVVIQYCTILFKLLTKKKNRKFNKKSKKKVKNKKKNL